MTVQALEMPQAFELAELCSGVGQKHTDKYGDSFNSVTWQDITAMMDSPPTAVKGEGQWAIFSTLKTRTYARQEREGTYYVAWADFDENPSPLGITIPKAAEALPCDLYGHSSSSATEAKQKSRLLIPLAEPCPGEDYVLLQEAINDRLALAGLEPDRVTERAGQLCYLPARGEFYETRTSTGSGPLDWRQEFAAELEALRNRAAEEEAQHRVAMEAAKAKRAQRQKILGTGQLSPVDAFEQEFCPREMWESYGAKWRGNRGMSPLSSSNSPALTISPDGRLWHSHHGSDLAAGIGTPDRNGGGCWGSSFDLFVHFEHGGDFDAAVKAAGDTLTTTDGITINKHNQRLRREQQKTTAAEDFDKLAPAARQEAADGEAAAQEVEADDLPGIPADLLALPHGLGEMQRYIYDSMIYPHAGAAGLTALAVYTAFAQTNLTIDSYGGLGFNELYMLMAPTGFGKESLRKPFERLLELLEWDMSGDRVGLEFAAPASAQGLHQTLEAGRSKMFLADEFADWLMPTAKGGGAGAHKAEALGYVMQLYTKALGKVHPGGAVTTKYETVEEPRFSLLTTSTAEAMMRAMSAGQAESGAYNRFVMLPMENQRIPKRYEGLAFHPDGAALEPLTWVAQQEKAAVTFSPQAWALFKEIDSDTAEPLRFKDGVMAGRLSEQAIKMAGLIALSDQRMEISAADLQTAYNIRLGLYHRTAALMEQEGAISGLHDTSQAVEQIKATLKKRKEIYRSQLPALSRKYKGLGERDRKTVIESLVDGGYMVPAPGSRARFVSHLYG